MVIVNHEWARIRRISLTELLRFHNIHRSAVYGQARLSYSKFADSLQGNRFCSNHVQTDDCDDWQ